MNVKVIAAIGYALVCATTIVYSTVASIEIIHIWKERREEKKERQGA